MTGIADIWVYTGIGLAYLNFLFGTMWTTAYGWRDEEFLGTLESIYVTPPSKTTVTLANSLYSLTYGGLTFFCQMLVLIFLFGRVSIIQLMYAFGFAMASVLMIQGISILLSILVLTFKQGWRIVFTFQVLLGIITPSTFPLEALPDYLQRISRLSPFTLGVEGFRNSLLFDPGGQLLIDIGLLVFWSLLLGIVGIRIYNYQEKRLMLKGSLGKY
jgi:ABC-2 type transport system permease protein